MNKYALLFIVTALSGCCLGPKCCVPHLEISDNWDAQDAWEVEEDGFSRDSPLFLTHLFDDPLLNDYLTTLVQDNYDIRLASAKICEAYALRQMSAAKLLPFIDGRIADLNAKPAGGVLTPISSDQAAAEGGDVLSGIPLDIKQQYFIADFDALWEIDLFGRNRKEVASAAAFICMQKASYQTVILALTAEFTRTYLELRRFQYLLNLVNCEIALLSEKAWIVNERLANGLDADISLLDSLASAERLSAEAPIYEGQVRSLMYRLAVLLAKAPASLIDELSAESKIPAIRQTIPIGFPSELLRRRPDIRYAEHEIEKATAEVGMAVADLFPKLTLFGSIGYQNLHLGNTRGSGESWGYGGNLLAPLFHGGKLKAKVKRNQWVRYQSFLAYEQTVLTALEEAESAIATFQKSQESVLFKRDVYSRGQERQVSTQELYDNGIANQLQLLESEINSIKAEKEWVEAAVSSEIQLIALYKALGGGNY